MRIARSRCCPLRRHTPSVRGVGKNGPVPAPDALARFSAPTREWFLGSFAAPTLPPRWELGTRSPTESTRWSSPRPASGKTLSAFLWAIDRLSTAPPTNRPRLTRVVFVSPLKALAVDVERNLRAPLAGIAAATIAAGGPAPQVTVGIRSGDTPVAARRQLVRTPPDILITTPSRCI